MLFDLVREQYSEEVDGRMYFVPTRGSIFMVDLKEFVATEVLFAHIPTNITWKRTSGSEVPTVENPKLPGVSLVTVNSYSLTIRDPKCTNTFVDLVASDGILYLSRFSLK